MRQNSCLGSKTFVAVKYDNHLGHIITIQTERFKFIFIEDLNIERNYFKLIGFTDHTAG